LASIDDLFEDMGRRINQHPDRLADLDVTYQFNLDGPDGGTWHLRVAGGRATVVKGEAANPEYNAHLSVADYIDLATGAVSGQELYFGGKMKVEGNPFLGMELSQLLAD
jgi:putative sterol carrier protein